MHPANARLANRQLGDFAPHKVSLADIFQASPFAPTLKRMELSGALGKLDLLSAIADKRSNLSWGKKRISLSWHKSLAGDTNQPRRSGADLTQT
ncbi:MAG: hypothetical protein A3H71_02675 [Candidatus Sungbacteria bacterium RIFCSPLOWO2_02_FULL_48_13b]|uniref:Uncharacterized protein n=1 Tax=Candidatus Sungbacteria bacterium RIFCSPLOWO2_02_FULL_48_13b TaxID=1802283 RepID=A0A1G2LJ38_9BACT|nr:MAG: hypothetical protein A3H71_02675 [Candidatus Sungbacteria bacterium RIFCSPLOWO2_02_FULL_48_13b]